MGFCFFFSWLTLLAIVACQEAEESISGKASQCEGGVCLEPTRVQTKTLDLGCGPVPSNPFGADVAYGIDLNTRDNPNIIVADLILDPIPFEDNFFDFVTAEDFLEHIPRIIYMPEFYKNRVTLKYAFVELMNEIWRVLKPGGKFLSSTPACHPSGDSDPASCRTTFGDPTHVNLISIDTFTRYFDYKNRWAHTYGFKGGFRVDIIYLQGIHLQVALTRVESVDFEDKPYTVEKTPYHFLKNLYSLSRGI